MERPRLRPLFKLGLPVPAPRLMAEIGRRLRAPDARVTGTVLKRHAELTVCPAEQHLWSPCLSLDVLDTEGGTVLRGRHAPHPSLWTFVMACYGGLTMLALAGLCYGLSQWILGWTPWALAVPAVCALGALALWLVGRAGQSIAHPQMRQLQSFLEECVHHASQPPGPR